MSAETVDWSQFTPVTTDDLISTHAERAGVPRDLLAALIKQESGGNAKAVNAESGAAGMGQLMPATAKELGVSDRFDPNQNIGGAADYLKQGLDAYGGDQTKALMRYYGGPDEKLWGPRTQAYPAQVTRHLSLSTVDSEPKKVDWSQFTPIAAKPDPFRLAKEAPAAQPNVLSDLYQMGKKGVITAAQDVHTLAGMLPDGTIPGFHAGVDDANTKAVTGKTTGQHLEEWSKEAEAAMSPEQQAANAKKWWDSDSNSFGPAWKDPRSWANGIVTSLPETFLTMIPGGILARSGFVAKRASVLASNAVVGMGEKEALAFANQQAAKSAAAAAGISGQITEGALGGAQSYREVGDIIRKLTPEQLQSSAAYQALIAQGLTPEAAREQLANDGATQAGWLGGIATGIFGGMGDRFLAKAIAGGVTGGFWKRTFKGAVSEGVLEEFPQGFLQQVGQNYALQGAKPGQPLMEDALNQAFGGLAAGSAMGAGFGAAGRSSKTPASAPNSTQAASPPEDAASVLAGQAALPVTLADGTTVVSGPPSPENIAAYGPVVATQTINGETKTTYRAPLDQVPAMPPTADKGREGPLGAAGIDTVDDTVDTAATFKTSPASGATEEAIPAETAPSAAASPRAEPSASAPAAPSPALSESPKPPASTQSVPASDASVTPAVENTSSSPAAPETTAPRPAAEPVPAPAVPTPAASVASASVKPSAQPGPAPVQSPAKPATKQAVPATSSSSAPEAKAPIVTPIEAFNFAHDERNDLDMVDMLTTGAHVNRDPLRAEWTKRTGIELPTKRAAAERVIQAYYDQEEEGKPTPAARAAKIAAEEIAKQPKETAKGAALREPMAADGIIEHVTAKGKTLRGVVRQISQAEAKAIDPFTFKKDDGYFIREKYLGAVTDSAASARGKVEIISDTVPPKSGETDKGAALRNEPPAPTKALIIPTRQGIKLQPVDDAGKDVGPPHMVGSATPGEKSQEIKNISPGTKPVTPQLAAPAGSSPLGIPKQSKAEVQDAAAKAKQDLEDALGDLGDIFGKGTKLNILPEQEQKLVPVLVRVFDAAFRLGYHEFKQAARFVLDTIRSKFGEVADQISIDHLQGAYISMAGKYPDATAKRDVIAVDTLADLAEAPIAPASEPAQTATEATDDSTPPTDTAQVDRDLAATATEPTVSRGAVVARAGDGRADDRGVRVAGERADGAVDEGRDLGDGKGHEPVSDGPDRTLERGGQRLSDFRAQPGDLTRSGSWFDTAERNVEIIELALKIQTEDRPATQSEQTQLAKYVGFGASEIRNALFPVPNQYQRANDPTRLIWPDLVYNERYKPLAERLEKLPRDWQESLLRSTQYAHYTSANVIASIWSAMQRMGFTGGKILEPGSGIGSFAMLMPDSVHASSRYTGVEFDGPTALIGKLLSPAQNMLHDDFIKRKFPKDYFDAAIGNPPFSGTVIQADPEYAKRGFVMHDYFFAKSIDRVRPGGLLMFVTSRGTLDKKTDKARKYLAERADLIGAIRLPQTAFGDNAGTSVVTDVIMLRKRMPGEAAAGPAWAEVKGIDTKDGPSAINEYYVAHPEMVLGQQRLSGYYDDENRRINGLRRDGEYVVVSYDQTAAELDAKFAAAVERLPQNIYSPLTASAATVKAETAKIDFDPSVRREGVVYLDKTGDVMRVENGVGVRLADRVKLSDKDVKWMKGFVGIRDLVQSARAAQFNDKDWEPALKALNKAYDAFRKAHGPLLDFRLLTRTSTDEDGNEVETTSRIYKNKRLFREDYDAPIVTQLETINDAGEIIKGKFLRERTIGKPVSREIKSVGDAMAVSLDELGKLDLEDVAVRLKLSPAEAIDALGTAIYKTPQGQWQLADEYLSGDVVTKLKEALEAERLDPSLKRNVEALKEAQPEKLGPSQISVKLGASWVPVNYINEFAAEVEAGAVEFHSGTESWQVEGGNLRSERKAGATFGTADRSPSELLEAALNSRAITVKKRISVDGKPKEVTDDEATTAANEVIKRLRDKFRTWVWSDSERAGHLVELYNDNFNNIAARKFDGSHLTLPGLRTGFKPHPHQLRAIWRQIQTGDTYLAHAVGAGKTFEMIAGGMEQKRLGLIRKPTYVVPNHMLEQFANEFMEFYPLANIMVADDENFSAERRRAFVAAATLNAPDAVIITHSAFERVGVKEETVAPIRDEMVAMLQTELDDTGKDDRVRRSQLEKQIESIEQRFDKIIGAGSKDTTVKFEDIGTDFVYVDEAHAYRKLDFATNQKVKGIDPNGSKRALDMYVKTRWLERQRPGRAMVFASGTPVTNTMGELYTIMRFFDQHELDQAGIATFDGWARQFGDAVANLEANATGKYEMVTRFAKFENVPELMSRVRKFMDVLTSSHLGALVQRPDLEGGRPNLITVPPTPQLKAYMETVLAPRLAESRAWKPSFDEPFNPDPVIAIISDGRFSALDPRFFGAKIDPDTPTKLHTMADRIVAEYKAAADNVYLDDHGKPESLKGSTQIVFYNTGFGAQAAEKRGFDARAALTKRLTDGGIKREHIAWFDDANTDAKKETIFKGMRAGTLRVLIGSAKKMGTGVNVQKRLAMLHYFDPPWYPSDVEQPHGRIIRQKNQNKTVRINWYATKGTYDSTMWQMVARKQRFIDQAYSGDKNLRTMDDVGEASQYEQAAAAASGDPRAIQLAGIRSDMERLERLQAAHANEQVSVRSGLTQQTGRVSFYGKRVAALQTAVTALGDSYVTFDQATVSGKTFERTGDFGKAIKAAYNAYVDSGKTDAYQLGQVNGQPIFAEQEMERDKNGLKPSGVWPLYLTVGGNQLEVLRGTEKLGADTDEVGLGRKFINRMNEVSRDLENNKRLVAEAQTEIERLRKKHGAPFEYQQDMLEKYAELKQLEDELRAEGEAAAAEATAAVQAAKVADAADDAPPLATFQPFLPAGLMFKGIAKGLPRNQAQKIVNEVSAKTNIPIHLFSGNPADLSSSFTTDTTGAYWNGKVYIFPSNIVSTEDLYRVLAHELVGHASIIEMMGDQYAQLVKEIQTAKQLGNPAILRLAAHVEQTHGVFEGPSAAYQESSEIIARAAEEALDEKGNVRPGYAWFKRILSQVAQWLRAKGIDVKFTEAELAGLLSRAAKRLEGRAPASTQASEALQARGTAVAPITPAEPTGLRNWYKAKSNAAIDRIDKFTNPLLAIPDARALLKDRYETLGKIARIDEIAKYFRDTLFNASDADKKAAYDYLTTAGAEPDLIFDAKAREGAARAKKYIGTVGDELVKRMLLPEESREAYRDQYLPRLYLKHLLDEKDFRALGAGKKPSSMGYLKARKDIPEETRRVILGEITDPGFLAAVAVGQPMRDMALLDFMDRIAGNQQWIAPNAIVNWNGRKATPMWLKHEADRLRRQAEYYAPEDAAKARSIALEMDTVADQAQEGMTGNSTDYKQMPDTPRYGMLRGLWVRGEIHDDLVGVYNLQSKDQNWAQNLLGYGGVGTKATQIWKAMKVSLNPPAQIRNFVSNGIAMQLSGVPLLRVPQRIIQAAREIADNGRHWQIAKKYGVTESTFSAQELFRLKRDLLDLELKAGGQHPLLKLKLIAGTIMDRASDLYQWSEAIFKTAKIIDAMEREGMKEADAALEAQRWLFDYSMVPQSVRYLRNAPIGMPFLCVDDQTEILTTEGWKTVDQVRVGDMAASFDLKDERLKWKPIDDIFQKPFEGEMTSIQSKALDILMTTDHRCVVNRRQSDNTHRFEIRRAYELTTRDAIPTAAEFVHEPVGEPITDAMAALLGWVIAEGTFHPSGVIIGQNTGEKECEIRGLLESVFPDGWTERNLLCAGGTAQHYRFYVRKPGADLIKALLPGKQLTPALLMRMSTAQIDILVEAMLRGDGHVERVSGARSLIQNPGETVDTFQMALMLTGRASVIRSKGDARAVLVSLKKSQHACLHSEGVERKNISWAGRVWCPSVRDTETWVARRNGKVFITHNTYQLKILPRLIETAMLHPQRFLPWAGIFYGMAWAALSALGGDDDDLDKMRELLPEWVKQRGHGMFLPIRDSEGRVTAADIGYYFPWTMYTDALQYAAQGDVGKTVGTLGAFSGPITSLVTAITTGVDPFTDKPIMNHGDPASMQIASALNWLWDMAMPPIIGSRGLVSPMGLMDKQFGGKAVQALTGTTDKAGSPRATWEQALFATVGLPLYGIEPASVRGREAQHLHAEVMEAERRMKGRLVDRSLTEEQRQDIVATYIKEAQRRQQKLTEFVSKTDVSPAMMVER